MHDIEKVSLENRAVNHDDLSGILLFHAFPSFRPVPQIGHLLSTNIIAYINLHIHTFHGYPLRKPGVELVLWEAGAYHFVNVEI